MSEIKMFTIMTDMLSVIFISAMGGFGVLCLFVLLDIIVIHALIFGFIVSSAWGGFGMIDVVRKYTRKTKEEDE